MVGERSLIQATVDRLAPVIPPERIWILTNDHLRDAIVRQLPEVPKRQILAEPAQRNTAPAIGLAAHILQSLDPGRGDGRVSRRPRGRQAGARIARWCKAAYRGAAAGSLMVVGIQPRWAETGYGYVEFPRGSAKRQLAPVEVLRFHEKPALAKARRYLAAGNFYWNSGMFFWRTDVLLDQLRHHLPKTATLLAALPPFGSRRLASQLAKRLSAVRQHLHRLRGAGESRKVCGHRRPAISAGTTWEAGTPSTN